jgi:S-adenosylmethionine-diacylgycerolhomoserine-N-methlytransferase
VNDARREAHRAFLNRYYGVSRSIYDLTRKYYLFGRDTALRTLLAEPWHRLIEVGPGTGRNLRVLHNARPDALLGGIEASDAMLEHARDLCPWARLVHGFAETHDYPSVLQEAPDRILFSYCISMVQDGDAALDNARRALAPGGEVMVVDFADLSGLPTPVRALLRRWLNTFHVEPVDEALLRRHGASITYGPGRYFLIARLTRRADA